MAYILPLSFKWYLILSLSVKWYLIIGINLYQSNAVEKEEIISST